ncbi:hypothetical protein NE237_009405 [Protea cynaroides]|uniref:WRKY domain-containing protein n=1 Tax=Protea cynaroides TaxID=273540 RepID=A0A9Q0R096_9MAGN|nr:hypothetical protein NE237_009405 [Protea cynaroides]
MVRERERERERESSPLVGNLSSISEKVAKEIFRGHGYADQLQIVLGELTRLGHVSAIAEDLVTKISRSFTDALSLLSSNKSYFRCAYRFDQGCEAAKQVQRTKDNPAKFEIKYIGHHTCQDVLKSSLVVTDQFIAEEGYLLNFKSKTLPKQDPPLFSSFSSIKQAEYNLSSSKYLPPPDLTKFKSSIVTPVLLPSTSQSNHGYYVSGSYFRCAYRFDQGCEAAKQVQRTEDNPAKFEIKYIGHHTCQDVLKSSFVVTDHFTAEEGYLLNFESKTLPKQDPPLFSSFSSIKQAEYNQSSSEYLPPPDLTKFKSSIATPAPSPSTSQSDHGYDVSGHTTSSSSNFDMDLELLDYVYLNNVFSFNDEELPNT